MGESVAPLKTDPIPAIRFISFVGLVMLEVTIFEFHQDLGQTSMPDPSPRTSSTPWIPSTPWTPYRIDPAQASAAQWTLVPGIGPAMAGRLEQHRAQGGFDSPMIASPDGGYRCWDLQAVSGIGPIAARRASPYLLHPALSAPNLVITGTSAP